MTKVRFDLMPLISSVVLKL